MKSRLFFWSLLPLPSSVLPTEGGSSEGQPGPGAAAAATETPPRYLRGLPRSTRPGDTGMQELNGEAKGGKVDTLKAPVGTKVMEHFPKKNNVSPPERRSRTEPIEDLAKTNNPSPPERRHLKRQRALNMSCGKGEPFTLSVPRRPKISGCYTALSQYNGQAMYASSGNSNSSSNHVVGAVQVDPKDPYDIHWTLLYTDTAQTKESFSVCNSVGMASTTHPADAVWACDLRRTGRLTAVTTPDFGAFCGCSEPRAAFDAHAPPEGYSIEATILRLIVVPTSCVVFALGLLIAVWLRCWRWRPKYVRSHSGPRENAPSSTVMVAPRAVRGQLGTRQHSGPGGSSNG